MKLKKRFLILLALVLTFAALFAVTMVSSSAAEGDVVTPYGTVPANQITDSTYVALFAQTGVDANGNPTYKLLETGNETGTDGKYLAFIEKGIMRAENYLRVGSGAYRAEVSYGNVVVYLLKDCTSKRGMGWQAGNRIDGKVTVDLGGHNVIATDPRLIGFDTNTTGADGIDVFTTIEFKNGSITTAKPLVEVYGNGGKYTGTKEMKVLYDTITFKPNGTLTEFDMINAKGGYNATQKADFEVEFNNCTFDYDADTALCVINDTAADGGVICTAKINKNCTIKPTAMPMVSDTSSEDRFGWGAGEYGTIPFNKLTENTYYAMFSKAAGATRYSFINTYNSTDYNENKTFVEGPLSNAKNKLSTTGSLKGGTVAVLMLAATDTTNGNNGGSGWNNAAALDGTLLIDLGGNRLVATAPRLIGFLAQNNSTFDSNVVIKNGTLETSKVIAEVWNEGAVYTGTKNHNLIFEDLKIIRSGSPTSYTMLGTKDSSKDGFSDTMKANFNVEFNNCNIDYSTASTLTLINDGITKGTVECNVTVKGGNISAKTVLTAANGFSSLDSFKFEKNESGKRTTFVYDYAADCSETTFMTDEGAMHLASSSVGNRTSYELSDTYVDGYGYIPASAENKVFSIFDAERKLHIASYDTYYEKVNGKEDGALERVRSIINPYATANNGLYSNGSVTMVLRKDYKHTDSWYGNYAHISGVFTLDLGGHTITQTSNGLFNFIAKKSNFGTDKITINDTTTIVKNGTILTRNQPVVKVNNNRGTGNFDYEGTKKFNITFENVTFDKYWATNDKIESYNSIIWSELDGTLGVDVNATFNNCNFTTCDSTIVDAANSNAAKFKVTVNGGVINTNNMTATTILKASDTNDTLTFGKGNDGNYTALNLPSSAPAPTESYNGGTLVFSKINEGVETTTYRLKDKTTEGITWSPKMSITLDRSIYLNVYVPTEALVKFTFDGVTYENPEEANLAVKTIDGKTYYAISTALPAAEALRNLSLNATITIGDNTATGKFNFTVDKYAKKIFSSGTLVEKQVLRDTLSYVRAAYSYFNPTDKKAIETVDTIIGKNYDVTSPVTLEGSTAVPTDGLIKASLNLSENPGIRFYIASNANAEDYSFYFVENGNEVILDVMEGEDDIGRYLEVDIYAYAMCETICYRTAAGASGSYHIASYHNFAKNDASLKNLVERFWKYAQSARDYRNAVRVTVNYVDASGNKLADSKVVYKAPGKDVKFLSPVVDGYYTRQLYVYSSATESETVNVVYNKVPAGVNPNTARFLVDEIVAWGDSITEGSNVDNVNAAKDHGIDLEALGSTANGGSYRDVLKNLITSKLQLEKYTIYNLGVGSESTTTIAARANTENYYFYINTAATLEGDAIVIDLQQHTGTTITDGTRMGVLRRNDSSGGFISKVYMTGKDENGNEVTIPGTLTCTTKTDPDKLHCTYDELLYTFSRSDGKTNKVTFDKNTRVVTEASVILDGKTCIIFMGENGGYNWDNDTIIAQQEEILEACGNPEFFLIISSTSKTTAKRQSLNDALTAKWGEHYINMGNVLNSSRDSYEFVGYSEEAIVAILDNIIEGSVTDLLLADACHPNAVGYAVIANTMFERFYQLGAFDELFDYYDSFYAN